MLTLVLIKMMKNKSILFCFMVVTVSLNSQQVLSADETDASATTPANKAHKKCIEYSKLAYEQKDSSEKLQCKHEVTKLSSESETSNAKAGEFPHMVILGYLDGNDTRWICNGILISEEFVLTAAHCALNRIGALKRARVGELNFNDANDDSERQEIEIAEAIAHPDFKYHYNDIALLKLKEKAKLNSFVVPACLNWNPEITETAAIETGWGRTEYDGEYHSHLQNVKLDIFTQEECNTSYAPYITEGKINKGIVADTQICAGHHTKGNDICQSGGPLQVYQKDDIYCMYSIIGFSSYRQGCSNLGVPAVYTRVSAYVQWIQNIVWK